MTYPQIHWIVHDGVCVSNYLWNFSGLSLYLLAPQTIFGYFSCIYFFIKLSFHSCFVSWYHWLFCFLKVNIYFELFFQWICRSLFLWHQLQEFYYVSLVVKCFPGFLWSVYNRWLAFEEANTSSRMHRLISEGTTISGWVPKLVTLPLASSSYDVGANLHRPCFVCYRLHCRLRSLSVVDLSEA